MFDLNELSREFPREAVHWRAQTVTRSGDKAMALAYIDARDVMDRLDQVCGASGWQDEYTQHGNRTICRIGIRVDDNWIWKSDGAGDTAVEGEKGSISDAFKRAAVKWGVGRYLYRLDAPWVPCETYERNGKPQFKRFTADPWNYVRGKPEPGDDTAYHACRAAIWKSMGLEGHDDECFRALPDLKDPQDALARVSHCLHDIADSPNMQRCTPQQKQSLRILAKQITDALNEMKEAA